MRERERARQKERENSVPCPADSQNRVYPRGRRGWRSGCSGSAALPVPAPVTKDAVPNRKRTAAAALHWRKRLLQPTLYICQLDAQTAVTTQSLKLTFRGRERETEKQGRRDKIV